MDHKADINIVDFAEQYLGIHLLNYQKKMLREFVYLDYDIVMPYKRGYTAVKDQMVFIKIMLDTIKG